MGKDLSATWRFDMKLLDTSVYLQKHQPPEVFYEKRCS